MSLQKTQTLSAAQIESIFHIWNRAYPQQISYKTISDFQSYLAKCEDPIHFLSVTETSVAGWLGVFTRNADRWFALIVDPDFQRQGIGQRLLSDAKTTEPKLCGWIVDHDNYIKNDGTRYLSPKAFYIKNGFTITEETFVTDLLATRKIVWASLHPTKK